MLDLETLGRTAGCKILSIGAREFDRAGLRAEFYVEIKRSWQGGLREEQATVEWWSAQEDSVKVKLFSDSDDKLTLKAALDKFNSWMREVCKSDDKGNLAASLWGNGSDFDNAILTAAYYEMGGEPPAWPYWSARCYRTLKNIKPEIKLIRQGLLHNALDDASSQAEHAARLLTELDAW